MYLKWHEIESLPKISASQRFSGKIFASNNLDGDFLQPSYPISIGMFVVI